MIKQAVRGMSGAEGGRNYWDAEWTPGRKKSHGWCLLRAWKDLSVL